MKNFKTCVYCIYDQYTVIVSLLLCNECGLNNFFLQNADTVCMKKYALLLLTAFFVAEIGFSLEVYKKNAIASFYGADFHGKKTSNGELFDMNKFTCANKELPFNTILKVTNLANNKTVQVRVNDRGPFVVGRDIDLSTAAAKELDMIKSGTAHVKIEVVKYGENTKLSAETAEGAKKIMAKKISESQAKPSKTKTTTVNSASKISSQKQPASTVSTAEKKQWDIQIASFSSVDSAKKCADTLYKKGFRNICYQTTKSAVRVVITKVPSSELETIKRRLSDAGYTDFLIKERKPTK